LDNSDPASNFHSSYSTSAVQRSSIHVVISPVLSAAATATSSDHAASIKCAIPAVIHHTAP